MIAVVECEVNTQKSVRTEDPKANKTADCGKIIIREINVGAGPSQDLTNAGVNISRSDLYNSISAANSDVDATGCLQTWVPMKDPGPLQRRGDRFIDSHITKYHLDYRNRPHPDHLVQDEQLLSYLEEYLEMSFNNTSDHLFSKEINQKIIEFLECRIGPELRKWLRLINRGDKKASLTKFPFGNEIMRTEPIEAFNSALGSGGDYADNCTGTVAERCGIDSKAYAAADAMGIPISTVNKAGSKTKTRCMNILGRAYEDGLFGLKRNTRTAVYLYKYGIMNSCPNATYNLARFYEFGREPDPEKAFYFYRASYKLGHIKGLHRYSLMLLRGNSFLDRDIPMGYHLLKMAAIRCSGSYPMPYYDLATLYTINNSYTIADPKYAFRIFLEGAKIGCRNCQYRVSEEYESGINVGRDLQKAFLWCKTAADRGQSDAQWKISVILADNWNMDDSKYRKGGRSINDIMKAVNITAGDYLNIIDLRKFYGNNFNKNDEIFRMARLSVSAGNPKAICFMGEAFENGHGTAKNELLGLWYYRIALSQCFKEVFYNDLVCRISVLERRLGIKIEKKEQRPQKGFLSALANGLWFYKIK